MKVIICDICDARIEKGSENVTFKLLRTDRESGLQFPSDTLDLCPRCVKTLEGIFEKVGVAPRR